MKKAIELGTHLSKTEESSVNRPYSLVMNMPRNLNLKLIRHGKYVIYKCPIYQQELSDRRDLVLPTYFITYQ